MKTDNDIDQLLMSGKKLSLSADEKNSIKAALLAHASQTFQHEKQSVVSPFTSWVLRGSVSFVALLLVFVGTVYASQDSLPGEPLYAMKVQVVEEMIALTKTAPEERVAYDAVRMETRLNELKSLTHQKSILAPELFAQVGDHIDQHVTDVTSTIEATETSELSHEKKIETLSRVAAISKAQSKVVQGATGLSDVVETITQANQNTLDALSATVDDFAKEKPAETVSNYLSKRMDEVSDQIAATSTDQEVRDSMEESLHDVDEALLDGSLNDAIIFITEAQQAILTDRYIESSDGGDGDGE